MNNIQTVLLALLSAPAVFLSGCGILSPATAPETSHYYINPYTDFSDIGRVVVIEIANNSNRAELSTILTDSITEALQKKHLFSLTAIHSTDPAWRNLDLDDSGVYSLEKLTAIREQLKANAILYGLITQYYPYPHMLLGLRLKMVDLRNGRLLWAVEQIWDSTDKKVEHRMKRFFTRQMRSGYQPMDWQLLVTSPRAFNKFVVYELAQTFPSQSSYMKRRLSAKDTENFSRNHAILKKALEIPQKTLKFIQGPERIEP